MGNTRKLIFLEEKTSKAFGSQAQRLPSLFQQNFGCWMGIFFYLFCVCVCVFFWQNTIWMGFLVFIYLLCKIIVLFKKIYKYTFFYINIIEINTIIIFILLI